jgi:hypothetical protein
VDEAWTPKYELRILQVPNDIRALKYSQSLLLQFLLASPLIALVFSFKMYLQDLLVALALPAFCLAAAIPKNNPPIDLAFLNRGLFLYYTSPGFLGLELPNGWERDNRERGGSAEARFLTPTRLSWQLIALVVKLVRVGWFMVED